MQKQTGSKLIKESYYSNYLIFNFYRKKNKNNDIKTCNRLINKVIIPYYIINSI
jgi:hypothetical protein